MATITRCEAAFWGLSPRAVLRDLQTSESEHSMKRSATGRAAAGPSQRQLKAGEIIRRALVDILRHEVLREPDLAGVSVTVGEVRTSPDLRHATAFVAPLGGGDPVKTARALTRCAGFLRGRLSKEIDMKFTPQLHFEADVSYDQATHITNLLMQPNVARDLKRAEDDSDGED
jgi:ribosome-binding factor A